MDSSESSLNVASQSACLPGGVVSAAVVARISERLGRAPEIVASAPGRLNLIGEHVDYNDGFVLPMAVERRCLVAGFKADHREAVFRSSNFKDEVRINLDGDIQPQGRHWSNYVRGVVSGFRKHCRDTPGLEAVILSNVPLGGGLSSSAALEVAVATFLEALTEQSLDPLAKAMLCQEAEHKFAGVPCGIMDQFASVYARRNQLMLLDCQTNKASAVPFNDPGIMIQVINTNVHHELVDGEYGKRRTQCESAARKLGVQSLRKLTLRELENGKNKLDEIEFKRARHVITEIKRTLDAANAIRNADWSTAGSLMYQSHDSLRDDFEVSCRELDLVVKLSRAIGEKGGVFGCRMTGAGFGGCTVSLVRASAARRVEAMIRQQYRARTKTDPYIFATYPAGGAMIHSIH